jgi:hypothetical protein
MEQRWILPVPEFYARYNHYYLGPFAKTEEDPAQTRTLDECADRGKATGVSGRMTKTKTDT